MNRLSLGFTLALSMAGNVSAEIYGEAGLDYVHASSDKLIDNIMLSGVVGLRINDYLGLETRLGFDAFSLIFDDDPVDGSGDFVNGFVAGFGRFTFPVSHYVKPYALLGWEGMNVSTKRCFVPGFSGCSTNYETHSGFAYGGGVDFRIAKGVYLKTEVTHFGHEDVRFNTFSVGMTGLF
ncbi:outer membrane beta-barrel protein [Hahella sp. NBU794]|uniref:outer membrane beta-barrel protein n=1 Tax=Hahella sp. NBU794 TaxID=3422590 RepID=UPI003D6F5719